MDNLFSWLSAVSALEWIAIVGAVFVALFVWWTRANQPAWFDFLMNFPIVLFGHIGEIKKIKGNATNLNNQKGWRFGISAQEKQLCDAYVGKIGEISSLKKFNDAAEYLEVTGQSSVKPMKGWMWFLLAILTVGEAAGTGALLSEFVSTTVTSNEVVIFTWGFAVFLAIVLLGLTHKAGQEFHTKMTFKKILGDMDPDAEPEGYERGRDVSFDSDQFVDKGKSQQVRFYARLEGKRDRGGYGWTISVVAALLVVFVLVFAGRWYGIKHENTLQTVQMEKNGVGADSSDPFASAGPDNNNVAASAQPVLPDVAQAQAESRKKVADSLGSDMLGQGFAASALLSMLYLLVQGLGFAFAHSHSFFQRGGDAYERTRGESSYESYLNKYFWPYAHLAEARLSNLRAHFARGNESYSNAMPTLSFDEYCLKRKQRPNPGEAQSSGDGEPDVPLASPNSSTLKHISTPKSPLSPAGITQSSVTDLSLAELASSIQSMPDKDARAKRMHEVLAQLNDNPTAISGLKAELTRLKEVRDRAKMVEDMDDLLAD